MADVLINDLRKAIEAYKFTITSKNDPQLLKLKKLVAEHNAIQRSIARKYNRISAMNYNLLRVALYARGPRTYRIKGEPRARLLHPNAFSNLQHKYATRFDVYIHTDRHAEAILDRELTTGLTVSEQRRVDKIENDRRLAKFNDEANLKKQGIYTVHTKNEYGRYETKYLKIQQYLQEKRKEYPNMPDATFNRIFC